MVFAKSRDLSMSDRYIICNYLLATDKSRYFAKLSTQIDN